MPDILRIGLDVSCEHPDWNRLGLKKWDHVQLWVHFVDKSGTNDFPATAALRVNEREAIILTKF